MLVTIRSILVKVLFSYTYKLYFIIVHFKSCICAFALCFSICHNNLSNYLTSNYVKVLRKIQLHEFRVIVIGKAVSHIRYMPRIIVTFVSTTDCSPLLFTIISPTSSAMSCHINSLNSHCGWCVIELTFIISFAQGDICGKMS